jgi:tRNA A-37 threonylcarbamoyl transferase component Bud32
MTDLRITDELSTGEILDGRYRLIERIGEGGMARVYRAEDDALQRTVAVKVLRGPVDGTGSVERALSETTVLASLNHHSLVTLFDAHISDEDASYLVMEYVEGITLRDLIAQGVIAPAAMASVTVDIAEGLHVAHTAGVVHRDIKPSNVLLWRSPLPGREWRAKLADFGIAYLLDSPRVTTPGLMVGTVAYIAPEQARGDSPAPPADIYALGIMLIEALTGTRPFSDAEGIGAVMARLAAPPPIPDTLPPAWQGLLRGMTATRPDDRPTALDVALAAARLAAGDGVIPATTAIDEPTAAMTTPAHTTMVMPAALIAAGGDTSSAISLASNPAPAAPALDAVTTATAATRRSQAAERARPRKRRLAAIIWVIAALLVAGALVAAIWSVALATTPTPTATTPAVVEPAVEPSVEPSLAPTDPEPAPAPVQDGNGNGNDNSGPGNNNGGDNSGPGNNNGNGNGNGNGGNGNGGNRGNGNGNGG